MDEAVGVEDSKDMKYNSSDEEDPAFVGRSSDKENGPRPEAIILLCQQSVGGGDVALDAGEKEAVMPSEEASQDFADETPAGVGTKKVVALSALAPCFYPRQHHQPAIFIGDLRPAVYRFLPGERLPDIDPCLTTGELQRSKPLLSSWWSVWVIHSHQKRNRWGDNLAPVTYMQSLPAFLRSWEELGDPGPLTTCGHDYACFRHGVKPMWESDRNKYGGHFRILLGKNAPRDMIRDKWMQSLLCIIGAGFGWYGIQVTGAIASCRPRGNRIEVWTEDSDQEVAIFHIGQQLKEMWDIPSGTKLCYYCHTDIFEWGQQEAMKNPRYRI